MSDTLTVNPGRLSEDDWSLVRAFLDTATQRGKKVDLSATDVLLSPAEVAERLGMSRTTVLRRIADKQLHAVKVGSHHRVPFGEYERYRNEVFHQMAVVIAPDIEAELFGE
jgi:excisionase family DNA binding protein